MDRRHGWLIALILVGGWLIACNTELDPASILAPQPPTHTLNSVLPTTTPSPPSPLVTPTEPVPTVVPTSVPATPTLSPPTPSPVDCRIGTGLRQEVVPIILAYQDQPGLMVMSASPALAAEHFPALEGWIRIIGAPSLADLQQKAERAQETDIPYDALAYGLETGRTTPDEEWQNLVPSTQQARAIADAYDKFLVMGPGPRLMAQNEDKYAGMVPLSHIWMFQTQEFQREPPGLEYRRHVARVVEIIRSADPNISIWAQITLPPDRDPSAEEWLAYREQIADLVDGTYIGVYTWQQVDNEVLLATIAEIFAAACGDPNQPVQELIVSR